MCLSFASKEVRLTKAVTAWRIFRWTGRGYLRSKYVGQYKYKKVNVDRVGDGFYVYKSARLLRRAEHCLWNVCAKVRISGSAHKHSNGYRAQKLRIVRLFVPDDVGATVKEIARLRKLYKVPVVRKAPR